MLQLPWHHRWNVLALTLLSQALAVGIQSFSFSFWVVPWLDEFKVPRSELMLAITASVFVIGLISPIAGIALDRYSARKLFCFSAMIFSIALLLISVATSHWTVVALYGGLLPVGIVVTGNLGCQTLVARWFPENRGFALGISALGVSIGAFAMPPIVTTLLAAFGWRVTFQLLAVAVFVLLVPAAWLALGRTHEAVDVQPGGNPVEPARHPQWTTALLLHNRDFWIIAIGFAAILFAYIPMLYSLGSYARDLGISQQQAAVGASLSAIALACGKLTFGKLTDLLEHRVLYWGAVTVLAFGLGLIAVANSYASLVVGLLFAGFAQGCYLPLMSSMIVDRFGTLAFGQVIGLVIVCTQFSAVAPFIAGAIRDSTGSYTVVFLVMLLPLLPAMIAMRWLSSRASA